MRCKNQSGMTLVEVLVSVALIAIVAVPLLQLFTASALSGNSGRYVSIATSVGRATLEEVRAGAYHVNKKLINGVYNPSPLPTHPDFTRQITISNDPNDSDPNSGVRKVVAKVSWTKGSKTDSIEITTLIY